MAKTADKIIEKEFFFLIERFSFHLEYSRKISGGYDILFVNNICGVRIIYEFREGYLHIMLHHLQNGHFVQNPPNQEPVSARTGYSLDDILLVRAPNAILKPAYSYGDSSEFLDKKKGMSLYFSKFAHNLETYAADVLKGDFRIFHKLEPIVRKRARFP